MHIRQVPLGLGTNNTGAPNGLALGLINPLSSRYFTCSSISFLSGALYRNIGLRAGRAPATSGIDICTPRAGGTPGNVSGKTSSNSSSNAWSFFSSTSPPESWLATPALPVSGLLLRFLLRFTFALGRSTGRGEGLRRGLAPGSVSESEKGTGVSPESSPLGTAAVPADGPGGEARTYTMNIGRRRLAARRTPEMAMSRGGSPEDATCGVLAGCQTTRVPLCPKDKALSR